MADDVGPVELECVHQRQHGLREELRVVAGADRLFGVAGARPGSRTHAPPPWGGRPHRRPLGANAPTVGRNDAFVPPSPCSISSGSPTPAWTVLIAPRSVGTVWKR